MSVNLLILGLGFAITMTGTWMTYASLAASRGWCERTTGTVVAAGFRTRASEDGIERWWRIDLEATRPSGPITVQVRITTGAADRIAAGPSSPFPGRAG